MSSNIDQVYIANPITTNASTDLIYIGQSPYGAGNDAAIAFSDFSAQFAGVTWHNGTGTDALYAGGATSAGGNYSIAFGQNAFSPNNNSISLGSYAEALNAGSCVIVDSTGNSNGDMAANQWASCFSGGYIFQTATRNAIVISSAGNVTLQGSLSFSKLITALSGGSASPNQGQINTILTGGGTQSAFTWTLPASPASGQTMTLSTTGIITTLTVNGNGNTVNNAPSSMTAGQGIAFLFDGNSDWYRLY